VQVVALAVFDSGMLCSSCQRRSAVLVSLEG